MPDRTPSRVPDHRERQFLQQLRDRGWVRAVHLVGGPALRERLLEKRWIESQGTGGSLAYRMTDEGMQAKKAPVRVSR
jgi:chromosome segregation and condensation protein ScpB